MPKFEYVPKGNIDHLNEDLYIRDNLQVKPFSYYEDKDTNHIKQFCVENGVYCLPTQELLDFLKEEIGGEKRVIEIGAGHGAIARELGIPATDSLMQNRPEIRELYDKAQQAVVRYGYNVQYYDALKSLTRFKPRIVIAAWVTHKYDASRHAKEGNQWGVEEEKLLAKVDKYIFIGNEGPHGMKPILDLPHRTLEPEWLISRGCRSGKDRIWIWEK